MRTIFNEIAHRIVVATAFVIMLAAPAIGQDADLPEIEVGVGYTSLTFPSYVNVIGEPFTFDDPTSGSRHHSGLFVDINWNRRSWFGFQNYLGVYALGNDVTLLADIPGARIAARNIFAGRVTPFVLGGFGLGVFNERAHTFAPTRVTYNHWSPAVRYGAGIDVQLKQSIAVRVEASRMALHVDRWLTNWNISTGLVFRGF